MLSDVKNLKPYDLFKKRLHVTVISVIMWDQSKGSCDDLTAVLSLFSLFNDDLASVYFSKPKKVAPVVLIVHQFIYTVVSVHTNLPGGSNLPLY